MTLRKIVNPSDQTQAFLPQFIGENYQTFVNFMAKAAEAQERQGFGQDLLQNLQRYRDFDTYSKGVVETGVLAAGISLDEEDEILWKTVLGFPSTTVLSLSATRLFSTALVVATLCRPWSVQLLLPRFCLLSPVLVSMDLLLRQSIR